MPKGRIGLSLEQDVLDILNKYGRGDLAGVEHIRDIAEWRKRSTRTEIIEAAVRDWAKRQRKITQAIDPARPNPKARTK